MSGQGIKLAAEAFAHLQRIRNELLSIGSVEGKCGTPEGNQDIRLGQLMCVAEEATKAQFMKETNLPEATDWGDE